jgi:hypothetical protein
MYQRWRNGEEEEENERSGKKKSRSRLISELKT